MAEIASAWVSILPSTRNFGARLTSQVSTDSEKAGKKAGIGFGKVFAAAAALGIGAKVGSFLGDSLGEAREAQKVGATTEAIIRSTGGAAKVTAAQVGDLASALSRKTGVDDEAIQSGANLLLTFKNVKREGEGLNDIFGRATAAAADLSAAGFGDLNGASKQLGKALNDPLKGITALSRSGVTFTEKQKARIKGLVEEGDLLGAQKIILKEVESQVGGVAEATATSGDKAKVAFGNIKESIGTALLPAVDALADGFVKLAPYIEKGVGKLGPIFSRAGKAVRPFVDSIVGAFSGGSGSGFVTTVKGIVSAIGINLLPVLKTAAATFQTVILPAVTSFASYMAAKLGPVFSDIARIVVNDVLPLLSRFGRFLYGTVIPAVVKVVSAVGRKLKPVFDQLVATFRADVLPTIQQLIAKFKENLPAIQKIVGFLGRWIGTLLKLAATVLGKVLPPVIRFAGFLFKNVVPAIATVIGWVIKIIAKVAEFAGKILDAGEDVVKFVRGLKDKFGEAVSFVKNIPGRMLRALGDLGKTLLNAGKEIIGGLIQGVKDKVGDLWDELGNITDKIPDFKGPLSKDRRILNPAGRAIMEGLISGIQKGRAPLEKLLGRVTKQIAAALKRESISKGMANFIRREVEQIANQYERLTTRIGKANTRLQNLLKARVDLMRSTAQNIRGELDLGSLASGTNAFGFGNLTFDSISGTVKSLVSRVQVFARKLFRLRKAGFPAALINEVAALGSQDGSRVASALLSGSRAQRQELIGDLRALNQASLDAGAQVARSNYDRSILDARQQLRERRQARRDFADALSKVRVQVEVGIDRRTRARLYMAGQEDARALA